MGGAIHLQTNNPLTFSGITYFTNNNGGAIIALSSILTFMGNTTFLGNSASYDFLSGSGGAIYTFDTVLSFSGTNNLAYRGGRVITANNNIVLSFSGTNNFINNSADIDGGAIFAYENTVLCFGGTNNFINNSAHMSGAICSERNNTLILSGIIYFTNNRDNGDTLHGYTIGGGVYLGLKSTLSILLNTTAVWPQPS